MKKYAPSEPVEMSEHEIPTRRTKIGFYIAYISLVVIALGVGLLLYWSLQPEDVLEVKNTPVPVRTIRTHPEADGVVILKIDYCKKIGATGRVRTSFVGESREVFLPATEDKQPAQCNGGQPGAIEIPVLIPEDLPAGHYHVHFRATYSINPLKPDVVEEFDSEEFEVVNHDDGTSEVKGTEAM